MRRIDTYHTYFTAPKSMLYVYYISHTSLNRYTWVWLICIYIQPTSSTDIRIYVLFVQQSLLWLASWHSFAVLLIQKGQRRFSWTSCSSLFFFIGSCFAYIYIYIYIYMETRLCFWHLACGSLTPSHQFSNQVGDPTGLYNAETHQRPVGASA